MIQLGTKVRDLITGVSGIAVGRTEWLYGCTRIAVESAELTKDGKPSEALWWDEQRVEPVTDDAPDAPYKKYVPAVPNQCDITLGSKVKDKVTGFSGIASAKTTWLSGTITITVEPSTLHEGSPVDPHAFESQRIELVEVAVPPMSSVANKEAPGGPQRDPKVQ